MRAFQTVFLPMFVLMLAGCGKKAAEAPAMPPAMVTYVLAGSEDVTITRDLPGRIDALRVAEIRARVPGILLEKTFQEGADVNAGDVLFKIDPAPLVAVRDSALASLTKAKANAQMAMRQDERFRNLVQTNAVSKLDADNSEAAVAIANAEVLTAEAALATAELNLGYATVTAPISGRIGKAEVTEGALVGEGSATLMAVIKQLDPIYFDFTRPSGDLVTMRRMMAESEESGVASPVSGVTLLLEDGSEYEEKGKLLFSEVTVDESTGMVTLRAEFPNSDRNLLPGMFARARVVQNVIKGAVTVPQRAVTRGAGGSGSVMVIDDENTVQMRQVRTSEITGNKWVVTSGLAAGDRVIMEGSQKTGPGAVVDPVPFTDEKATDDPSAGPPPNSAGQPAAADASEASGSN